MEKSASRAGFTLAEISVVIVIVALIVGGIVVASQMLYTAKIQKTASQLQQIKSNMMAFKLKYGKYPGDFDRATQFWPSTDPLKNPRNGNGDGKIASQDYTTWANYEAYNAFHHLSLAGMIWGTYLPVTGNDYDPYIWPQTCAACAVIVELNKSYVSVTYGTHWTSLGLSTNWLVLSSRKVPIRDVGFLIDMLTEWGTGTQVGILGKDAWALDNKMDDGMPLTGSVKSNTPVMGGEGGIVELSCVKEMDDESIVYNLDSSFFTCVLLTPIEG